MWSPRQQDGHTRIAGPVWTVEYVRVGKEKQAATDQQPLTPAGHYVRHTLTPLAMLMND